MLVHHQALGEASRTRAESRKHESCIQRIDRAVAVLISGITIRVPNAHGAPKAGEYKARIQRIDDTIGSLTERITAMEDRLNLREQELRQQFSFADQAISSLNNQSNSLASIGQLF